MPGASHGGIHSDAMCTIRTQTLRLGLDGPAHNCKAEACSISFPKGHQSQSGVSGKHAAPNKWLVRPGLCGRAAF